MFKDYCSDQRTRQGNEVFRESRFNIKLESDHTDDTISIEPYRLKELIYQDFKFPSRSLVSEMDVRLLYIPFTVIQKNVRKITIDGEFVYEGGRKYRRYCLP